MPQALKIPDAKAAVEKTWKKLEVTEEARNKGRKVHFASLMDLCHLKNSELEPQNQKYKGRVVLRGDIVKDDSGSYAVFTEQGSSASQMTAAKIMDIVSRLPGCAGQAADAVSAMSKWKMHRRYWKFQNCPDIWILLPKHKWPISWSSVEDPIVPLERNLYGHSLAGLLWERQFEKVLLKYGWGNFKIGNVCSLTEKKDYSYHDIKLAGTKQNIISTWKIARGKRVRGGFRSGCAYGRPARPLLYWVGDHEDIEEFDDGDDGQRRGANKRRSNGMCQRIGLFRYGDASWRNSRISFSRESLRGSWVCLPLDQRSKTTSHQKGQENWLQFFKPCAIRSSLVYLRVPLQRPRLLHHHLHHRIPYQTKRQIHRKTSIRKKWKYEWGATGKLAE